MSVKNSVTTILLIMLWSFSSSLTADLVDSMPDSKNSIRGIKRTVIIVHSDVNLVPGPGDTVDHELREKIGAAYEKRLHNLAKMLGIAVLPYEKVGEIDGRVMIVAKLNIMPDYFNVNNRMCAINYSLELHQNATLTRVPKHIVHMPTWRRFSYSMAPCDQSVKTLFIGLQVYEENFTKDYLEANK